MQYIIDRFEGTIAICEDENKNRVEFEKDLLPSEAQEGSAILVGDNGAISLTEDADRTSRIAGKMKSVWR